MTSRKQIADAVMSAYPDYSFVNSDPENYDPYFTWSNCELCDGLAGDRYNVAAIIPGETTDKQIHFEVCVDCMYYVAYGEGPPDYMGEEN